MGRSLEEQAEARLTELRALWRQAGLHDEALVAPTLHGTADRALRERVDLGLVREGGRVALGLRGLHDRAIVDQPSCPMLTAPLQAWVDQVRADPPPIDPASLRLRVAPDGARGLWLDAANLAIKALLDEGDWLRRVSEGAILELGQRHKRAQVVEGRVRLVDPELYPWFETFIGPDLRPAPLYGTIGGFSQPGRLSDRVLVDRVRRAIAQTGATRWVELGCGSGNLTLPLAAEVERVLATDIDPWSLLGLRRSLAELDLAHRVQVERVSFGATLPWLEGAEAALVDPPRSGLGPATEGLLRAAPRWILYVSCHAGSLVADLARLLGAGYGLVSLDGVDQFPHTPHGEWVALLQTG